MAQAFESHSSEKTLSDFLPLVRAALPTSSAVEYVLRNTLIQPLMSRLLAIVFTRSGISVKNVNFLPEISRIGQNEYQIRFLCHLLRSIGKNVFLGLHAL